MEAIGIFASEYGLRVIEDAAHAMGSRYQGERVGSIGDIVCFSFDGIKNITCGEGGAVVSGDMGLIERVREARGLGIERDSEARYKRERRWEFDVKEAGWRYHMSDINAAIGRVQLNRLEVEFGPKRQLLVKRYQELLENIEGVELFRINLEEAVPHIMPVRVLGGMRDEIRGKLEERGIEVGMHYKPGHLLTRFRAKYSLPVTERLYEELLTLPLHVDLELTDVEEVTAIVRDAMEAGCRV